MTTTATTIKMTRETPEVAPGKGEERETEQTEETKEREES